MFITVISKKLYKTKIFISFTRKLRYFLRDVPKNGSNMPVGCYRSLDVSRSTANHNLKCNILLWLNCVAETESNKIFCEFHTLYE